MAFKKAGPGRPYGSQNKAKKELASLIDASLPPEKMVDGLVKLATGVENPPAARIAAYKELLDRRFGKAPQALTGGNGGPIEVLAFLGKASEQQLEELIANLGVDVSHDDGGPE